ncbi:MAG TPA: DUF6295 family protein [Candidatus Limnocylindria bacterium]|nr:DUF6295 family protein [Candidatus Limnocylindria bacterium]
MCTNIATATRIAGSAKTAAGWRTIDEAIVGYDHATHLWTEHAVRLDLVGRAEGVAVELDLASAKALLARLEEVVSAAERSGVDA